jgi:hypothetical protein
MSLIIGIENNDIINVYQPPIDFQRLGGVMDGDGDTGHIPPLPFPENEESPE